MNDSSKLGLESKKLTGIRSIKKRGYTILYTHARSYKYDDVTLKVNHVNLTVHTFLYATSSELIEKTY